MLKEIRNFIVENKVANMAIQEVLIKSMERQKTMQKKLTDLEGRSRWNNISISGIPEGKEGNYVSDFAEKLLKNELIVDTNLQIQRTEL